MTYGVIGGDRRQMELAALMAAEGTAVAAMGWEQMNRWKKRFGRR